MAATLLTTAPVLGLTPTDLGSIVDELHAYHAIFSLPACPARAAGVAGHLSLQGLLLDIPCTSIEPVMLHLCGADRNAVRTLQSFVSISARDDAPILVQLWRAIAADLGDGSGFPNEGTHPSAWSDRTVASGQDGRPSGRGLFGLRHRTGLHMLKL